jgi:hypothetical protein
MTKTTSARTASLLVSLIFLLAGASDAFVAVPPPSTIVQFRNPSIITLRRYGRNDHDNHDSSSFDWPVLQARLDEMRLKICEDENFHQPPNANLDAYEFVSELLHGIWDHSNPLPDAGMRRLLRASTPAWRQALYQSVGAPYPAANVDVVASALHEAMARPDNQFALLLEETTSASAAAAHHQQQTATSTASRSSRHHHDDREEEKEEEIAYRISFPHEALDYADGTCWLECQLRSTNDDDKLLVSTGWELRRRASDNAWLVDRIDWQDFRDAFRPGIGRQEWTRVCG